MSRVKRGVTSHAKHKKVYKLAKGFRGRRKNTIRTAKAAVEKAAQYAFRDRKRKKRTFRALWIQRLNAAVRPLGMTYSVFINGLVPGHPRLLSHELCKRGCPGHLARRRASPLLPRHDGLGAPA
jgi:ribosomal protein L20